MTPPTKVMFFCLGNICRSPLAHGWFAHHARARGVGERFTIDPSGTSAAHGGELPDPGSRRVARRHGVCVEGQRAQQLNAAHVTQWDVLVTMDLANLRARRALASSSKARLVLMRDFEPNLRAVSLMCRSRGGGGDDAFEAIYTSLERATARLRDELLMVASPTRADLKKTRSS